MKFAIVDIETTGGHAAANGITEVAIVIHDGVKTLETWQQLINPGQKVPAYITALTGISNAMVASAPQFDEVAEEIFNLLQDKIFVAHNVNFDYSFLRHHLEKCQYRLNVKKLCTVRLSRKLIPGLYSYSLGNICRQNNIVINGRHRAMGDAEATVTLFEKLMGMGAEVQIAEMLKKTSSEQWLPLHLEKKQVAALPGSPGVYYFHDVKGKIIYVGKAVNIRKRVTGHFTHYEAGNRRQHFLRLIHNVSFKCCANELHALVLESTEIKRLWPKYNYSQKQATRKFGLYSFEDNKGYTRLAIDIKRKSLPALYSFNGLHEGMVMLKKMADEFGLDHRLCYIDKTPLGDDRVSAIPEPRLYNEKVKQAIEKLNEKLPSFAVLDDGLLKNEKLCMLVHKGMFWGMGYLAKSEEIENISALQNQLERFADNDFIRNSIFSYAEANPDKVVSLA